MLMDMTDKEIRNEIQQISEATKKSIDELAEKKQN